MITGITCDSIDADTCYPTDAFYVHRLYLATMLGDIELTFPYTDSNFPNVISSGCCANIFNYDNDSLMDMIVTISYLDDETNNFILQLCGASIRIYHRLPATLNHKYRFELAYQRDIAGINLGTPEPANLNGISSDGKEGWVIPVKIDTSMSNELNTAPGLLSMYKVNGDWEIFGTCPDTTAAFQYIGTYSNVTIYDYNSDGYDDAVIKCDVRPVVVPYDTVEHYMAGDIKLFLNMRGQLTNYQEDFSHGQEASIVLWANDAITWDLHCEDFDEDGEPELGCALSRREPAWDSIPGNFGIYYTEIGYPNPWNEVITNCPYHSITIPDTALLLVNGNQIAKGDAIGLFYDSIGNEKCCGQVLWNGDEAQMIAWGDDSLTSAKEGYAQAEIFKWKVWDASEAIEYEAIAFYDSSYSDLNTFAFNGQSAITSLMGVKSQNIELPNNWSIVSSYINPVQPAMSEVFQNIVSNTIIVKDENGLVYWPTYNINLIGDWSIEEAYQLKVYIADTLTILGSNINPDSIPVFLPADWSLFAYLCQSPLSIETLLNNIISDVIMIKNGNGEVYWPGFVNQIITMIPGEGYQVKMTNSNTFYYQCNN